MTLKTPGRPSPEPSIVGRSAAVDAVFRNCRALIARTATAALVAWAAMPSTATAQMTLEWTELSSLYNTALYHRYSKALGHAVQSVCYVDFKVPGSMGCVGRSDQKGSSSSRLRSSVKREARRICKGKGGKRCRLFWRNNEIETKRLSGEGLEKLQSILNHPGSHEAQGAPLPDGVSVGKPVLNSFKGMRRAVENYVRSQEGAKFHYSICGDHFASWAAFIMGGEGVELSHVRNLCVLKCEVLSKWNDVHTTCYGLFENGKFASEAAEKALMN